MMFQLCICLFDVVMSDQINSHICQITLYKFNKWRSWVLAPQQFAFLFLPSTQTHATKHILTHWSLLLVCLGWALSLGWWFVTHSLCTLKLAPNLSLQTPPNQHPVPSVTLPLPPFSLPLSLEFFCQSLGRDADAIWQGTECVQDFMSVLFFSIHIGQVTFMSWLCWIRMLCHGRIC